MDLQEFVEFADLLGDRQAEAWFLRRVDGVGRQEAAEAMETSASNVDNLERAAHAKIIKAHNLVNLVEGAGVEYEGEIGVCAVSDEPVRSLVPHPDDDGLPLAERRMVSEEVAERLSE